MDDTEGSRLFLGIDISTQQVKIIMIDDQLKTVYEDAVKFHTEFPEFGTVDGARVSGPDNLTVTSPTLMWVKAVDKVLDNMKEAKINFKNIAALSGSGQQHGSVYWAKGAREVLSNMQAEKTMYAQLKQFKSFSIGESPIWMDSSTTKQCQSLEESVGGPENLARITGSKAYERFTGNQIAKMYQQWGKLFTNTERISLVSSFGASLFIGDYAPIDYADGSGMNLLDIQSKHWSKECCDACAPDLAALLGEPVPSNTLVGKISSYMVERYGFDPSCQVIAFTGDNPASLAAMRLEKDEIAVSLGTSDTLFLWLTEAHPATEGHIWVNPVDSSAFMALLCYKNGSLTREKIRNIHAEGIWSTFENKLNLSPKGNNGNIGIYYDNAEITPTNAVGHYRFNRENKPVQSFSPEEEIRALVEGQFIAKRVHAEKLGYSVSGGNTRILATGGASANKSILQILADVFNSSVFVIDIPNSASLGSAYRAKHGLLKSASFSEATQEAPGFMCAANPDDEVREMYNSMTIRYKELENQFVRK